MNMGSVCTLSGGEERINNLFRSLLRLILINPGYRIYSLHTNFFLFMYDVFRSLSFLSDRVDGINFSLRYMLSGMIIRVIAIIILTHNYFSALNP
jgi:hypothetical protein